MRSEGVWGERIRAGALFFSLLRGSERAIHKNFCAWVTEESAGEVASLQRIARSISGLRFACLFVSLGSFGTILVIEIPNSMV